VNEALELAALIALLLLPLVATAVIFYLGWRATRRIRSAYLRAGIRALLAAVAFTPTVMGHAFPVPAWWVLLFGPSEMRLSWGLKPLCIVWGVLFCIAVMRLRSRPLVTDE
jgi:hypothetical protein